MGNETNARSVSITMTGSGGSGVMTAGTMLLDSAARAGYYGYMTRSLGPQIRGGEAAAMIRIGVDPANSHSDRFDMLFAIDWLNIERFAAEIPLDGESLIVGDHAELPDGFMRGLSQSKTGRPRYPYAVALAEIGHARMDKGDFPAPDDIRPLYLREPDVTINWAKLRQEGPWGQA